MTLEDLSQQVTDLAKAVAAITKTMATREDLKGFATKEDLSAFSTKEDLKVFATKEDLSGFATKKDLKVFATKVDLNGFATKEDLKNMESRLEERTFSREEKENILTTLDHYNQQLEAAALGKGDAITLSRKEYDVVVKIAHLPNRFTQKSRGEESEL